MLVINIYDIFFNVEGFLLVFQTFERSLIFTTSGIVIATTLNVKSYRRCILLIMQPCSFITFVQVANMNSDCGLKQRLYKHWLDVCRTSDSNDFHSSPQRFFFSLCKPHHGFIDDLYLFGCSYLHFNGRYLFRFMMS